jgi:hypothetical protein
MGSLTFEILFVLFSIIPVIYGSKDKGSIFKQQDRVTKLTFHGNNQVTKRVAKTSIKEKLKQQIPLLFLIINNRLLNILLLLFGF